MLAAVRDRQNIVSIANPSYLHLHLISFSDSHAGAIDLLTVTNLAGAKLESNCLTQAKKTSKVDKDQLSKCTSQDK